ncbi:MULTISPECIES: hypothetical protein [unclassified Thioalkalivibrio]|uniref:hypothetical protein n=1 Tax=unclassified Thioalkalivibrio TaxID=2621013 RepID=UPI0003664020|nr:MULTISPECIES: hypothetical protein [unclassified Thioalkalivibrio]
MARQRTVSPDIWGDDAFLELSYAARLVYLAMRNFADDGGVLPANAKTVVSKALPGDAEALLAADGLIGELVSRGFLIEWTANDGKVYWADAHWSSQYVHRPTYRYPSPPKRGESYDLVGTFGDGEPVPQIYIPLRTGDDWLVPAEDILAWVDLYRDIDVLETLRKAREWNLANPKKRKTPEGIRRHLIYFLNTANGGAGPKPQDAAPSPNAARPSRPPAHSPRPNPQAELLNQAPAGDALVESPVAPDVDFAAMRKHLRGGRFAGQGLGGTDDQQPNKPAGAQRGSK